MDRGRLIELSLAKLNDGKDITWEEITELCEWDVNPDHCRKVAYGIKLLDDYLKENNIELSVSDEIDKYDKKIIEFKKERKKLNDTRAMVNREITKLSRIEHLIEIFEEELRYKEPKSPILKVESTSNFDMEGVLLLSDIHYGAEFKTRENEYNPTICVNRFQTLLNEVVNNCKVHNIHKIHVFLLGDLINGLIHTTTRLENKVQVIDQVLDMCEILSTFLHSLCEHIDEVMVYYNPGNHDRVFEDKKDNINVDDFGRLLMKYLERDLREVDNIDIVKTEVGEPIVTKICNNVVFGSHGDKDSLKDCVSSMSNYVGIVPDYIFLGHYHHPVEEQIANTNVVVNGSFAGNNEYSSNLRLKSPAIQKFLVFNFKGKLCSYDIKL